MTEMTAMETMEDLTRRSADFWEELQKHPKAGCVVKKIDLEPGDTYFAMIIDMLNGDTPTVRAVLWAAWKISGGNLSGWTYDGYTGSLKMRGVQ